MSASVSDPESQREIRKRRTFAIISHPDAGKTTLTEKLLLYSGLIRTAGLVKNRRGKAATSDWMGMERERGISITSSAMQFPYKGAMINVLDTPGHEDFSEDTYRTLTAADSAIMVLDAMKGVQAQTLKLFEVCRLRGIPVLTFINKLDMPGRDPLDLMHEVEEALGIQASAFNWPIGSGKEFAGVIDRRRDEFVLFKKTAAGGAHQAELERYRPDDPRLAARLGADLLDQALHDRELLEVAGNAYTQDDFLAGKVTPVFFGSALTNFGLEPFFDAFVELAPSPGPRPIDLAEGGEGRVDPYGEFSAFVFKIQANMDRRHRDVISFIRICSGRFTPNLVVKHHRLEREIRLSRPHSMVAQDRNTLDEAYAGDVVGLIGRDLYHIGDTLSVTGGFTHKPMPAFQPEIFARIAPKAPSLRKRFDKGMKNLIAEGAVQLVKPVDGSHDSIVGAVGRLQFEVLQYRLEDEYGVETRLDPLPYECSAWLEGDPKTFKPTTSCLMARDQRGRLLVLFRGDWDKRYAADQNPDHLLLDFA
ncbi:MAG: peptide chain release factor 3 [Planctomycetes bacterium]|nr:peptide chain release factor 3 [Planctomycetota bacterium]